jgi:MarR family transcriptional regulator, organic hydroperoxide resistance regulator
LTSKSSNGCLALIRNPNGNENTIGEDCGIPESPKLDISSIWNYIEDMDDRNIIAGISGIRNKANEFLVSELVREGLVDVAPSHGYILFTLFSHDGVSMKEITLRIKKRKNTVTVLIDKLRARGFIRKVADKSDRRTTRIFLTAKGKAMEESFKRISDTLIERAFLGFTENQKKQLVSLLEKMDANFG